MVSTTPAISEPSGRPCKSWGQGWMGVRMSESAVLKCNVQRRSSTASHSSQSSLVSGGMPHHEQQLAVVKLGVVREGHVLPRQQAVQRLSLACNSIGGGWLQPGSSSSM